MLSILIPTYNYNVYPLASELAYRAQKSHLTFELICMDDGSNSDENEENQHINNLPNCTFIQSQKNNGRTRTRQLLAERASYEWLLFLDADVMPKNDAFLTQYASLIAEPYPIVFGGIAYNETDYKPEHSLRFTFGSKREVVFAEVRNKSPYKVICSANFMIKKSLFLKINALNLNHAYGMDYIFGTVLRARLIPVKHIDNEVFHLGIDKNSDYLEKTRQGLKTLDTLNRGKNIKNSQISLLRSYVMLKKLGLHRFFGGFISLLNKPITKHLLENKSPNLFVFDMYRLGYFCRIRK